MLRTSLLGCCSPQCGHGRGPASPRLWELSWRAWGTAYSTLNCAKLKTQNLHCELCPSFFTSIVGRLVAAATSCGGEDPGAVGAWVAALGRRRFFTLKHLFAIEDMFMWNTSPVWDCMWSSRSSLDWKTVLASAQSATFGQVKRVFCGIIEEAVHTWQERRPCFAAMWLNSWYLERFLFWYLKYA